MNRRCAFRVPGPNWLWSIDAHCKLEHFGLKLEAERREKRNTGSSTLFSRKTGPIGSAVQGPTAQFRLELNVCSFIENPRTPIGHSWMKSQVVGSITKVMMRDEFLRAEDEFTTEEVWVRRLLQQVPSQHRELFLSYESKRAAQLRIVDDFTGPNKRDPS